MSTEVSVLSEAAGVGAIASARSNGRWLRLTGVLIAAALLVLAVRGLSLNEVAAALRHLAFYRLVPALALAGLSLFLRAMRWRVLLKASAGVSLSTAFWSSAIGYLGNYALPGRIGDVLRCTAIRLNNGIAMAYALGTAVAERVIDAAVLVGATSLAAAGVSGLPAWMPGALRTTALGATLGLVLIVALPFIRVLPRMLGSASFLPARVRCWLTRALADALLGVRALHDGRRGTSFAVLTVTIWCSDILGAVLVGSAFGFTLPIAGAVLYIGANGLSSALPATPGNIGLAQFIAVAMLAPFGVPRPQALLFSLAAQSLHFAIVSVCGLFGFWRLRLSATSTANSPTPKLSRDHSVAMDTDERE